MGKKRKFSKNRAERKQVFQVEAIRAVRKNMKSGEKQYEIKWIGYPESQNTWEPAQHLIYIQDLIKQFERKQLNKKPTLTKFKLNNLKKVQQKSQKNYKKSIQYLNSPSQSMQVSSSAMDKKQNNHSSLSNLKQLKQSFQDILNKYSLKKKSQNSIQPTLLDLWVKNKPKTLQFKKQQTQEQKQLLKTTINEESFLVKVPQSQLFDQKKQNQQLQLFNYQQCSNIVFNQSDTSKLKQQSKISSQKQIGGSKKSQRLKILEQRKLQSRVQESQKLEQIQSQQIDLKLQQNIKKEKGIHNTTVQFKDKIYYCIKCSNGTKKVTKQTILRLNPNYLKIYFQSFI